MNTMDRWKIGLPFATILGVILGLLVLPGEALRSYGGTTELQAFRATAKTGSGTPPAITLGNARPLVVEFLNDHEKFADGEKGGKAAAKSVAAEREKLQAIVSDDAEQKSRPRAAGEAEVPHASTAAYQEQQALFRAREDLQKRLQDSDMHYDQAKEWARVLEASPYEDHTALRTGFSHSLLGKAAGPYDDTTAMPNGPGWGDETWGGNGPIKKRRTEISDYFHTKVSDFFHSVCNERHSVKVIYGADTLLL